MVFFHSNRKVTNKVIYQQTTAKILLHFYYSFFLKIQSNNLYRFLINIKTAYN